MSSKQATYLVSGFTEVATAQTAVQLTTTIQKNPAIATIVSFSRSNTGTQVAIGASKATTNAKKELAKEEGVILEKGHAPLRIEGVDPTQIWVDVEKSKDGVSWLAEYA